MAKIILEIQPKNKEAAQYVRVLNAEFQTLSKTLSSVSVNKDLTAQIKALTANYKEMGRVVRDTLKIETQQITNQIKQQKAFKVSTSQVKTLEKRYADLINTIKSLEKNYPKGTFDSIKTQAKSNLSAVQGLTQGTANYEKEVQRLSTELQNFQTQLSTTRAETKSTHGSLLDIVSGFAKFQFAAMAVMKPLQLIRSALSSINETLVKTEDRVIELQRVVGDVANANELYALAEKYGQTFENVSEATLNFARRGMSWNESLKATEAALLAINVAELDVGQATDGLGAIMAQFGLQASELTTVVDMLNKTADKFPVTTSKILAALQRVGSTASTSNLSLEETIGLITTLSKATNRSGENIGTALNSILNIAQKDTTLDTFSKLGDSVKSVVEQYRGGGTSILEVLRAVSEQVQQLDTNQIFSNEEFESLNEQLKESMGEDFEMLSEIYGTAGTYRRNYFIALLNDLDTVKQVEGEIANAQGYSQTENQKYLDTYTAKLNTLKAQWEDIANDENGLLGLKKLLVDIASATLSFIKKVGGLRTILLAISTIVWQLKGAQIIAGIKSIGAAIKALITGLNTAKTAAQGFQAAMGWIGLIATGLSLVVGWFQNAQEESREDYSEGLINAQNALDNLSASIESTTQQYEKYKKAVEEARAILNDESSTTSEIAKAKDTLLTIQDALTKSNSDYADSIDVVNGNLQAQLGLLDKLNEEQARKQVQDYIRNNKDAIENAKKYQSETFSEIKTGESGGLYGGLNDENFLLTNFLGGTQGSEENFWDSFSEGFKSVFGGDISGYAQLGEKKNREQIIAWLEEQYDRAQWYEDKDELQSRIRSLINTYQNNEDYNTSYKILHGDSKSSDWIERLTQEQRELFAEGKLTYQQIKEILGLEKEIDFTSAEWHNNISKVTGKYDDLISKLEELRDLQKESTDWEEKKLAVLEAEQALENARNEATVRRFNQTTGQWEWQADEKAIAEAEENLEKAQLDLQEAAFDNIIGQLEKGDATNESILAILQEVAPLLGADSNFVEAVTDAFKEKTGVDITKPSVSNFDAAQNYITSNGLKESERENWTEDKIFATLWNKLTADEQAKLKGTYDSGGIANGLGFMAKATVQPESVNDPELTRKILTPVSNAEFDRYVKDMGIMFAQAHNFAQMPQFERVNNTTDNRIDNSGQINFAGGITFPAEAQNQPLSTLLAQFKTIPN